MNHGRRYSVLALGLLMMVGVHANPVDRISTVTYNAQGLIDSVDGPRTDVSDITRYAYDTQGRLASVTDALEPV